MSTAADRGITPSGGSSGRMFRPARSVNSSSWSYGTGGPGANALPATVIHLCQLSGNPISDTYFRSLSYKVLSYVEHSTDTPSAQVILSDQSIDSVLNYKTQRTPTSGVSCNSHTAI